jgi:hypothetical protein
MQGLSTRISWGIYSARTILCFGGDPGDGTMNANVFRKISFGLLLLITGSCATAGTGSGTSEEGQAQSRNVLVKADLEGMDHLSVYQALRRLKPQWIRNRGQAVITDPGRESLRVYMNGAPYGRAASLTQIQIRNVEEIQFLDSRRATLRFGTDHTLGAILIKTRKG